MVFSVVVFMVLTSFLRWVGCGLRVASAAYEATDVACYVSIVPAGGGMRQALCSVVIITVLWVVLCLCLCHGEGTIVVYEKMS